MMQQQGGDGYVHDVATSNPSCPVKARRDLSSFASTRWPTLILLLIRVSLTKREHACRTTSSPACGIRMVSPSSVVRTVVSTAGFMSGSYAVQLH